MKVRMYTIDREGLKSIWVKLPDDFGWNIWDLPENKLDDDVKKAIIHAFELGVKFAQQKISKCINELDTVEFEG